jgi:hypothetical protein
MSGNNTHNQTDAQSGEETVFVADNVDEFIQRTRWKQILDAGADAREALRDVGVERVRQGRDASSKRQTAGVARSAVESFVVEAEPLFQGTAAGRELWKRTQVAEVRVADALTVDKKGEVINVAPTPDAELSFSRSAGDDLVAPLKGISDYLAFPEARVRVTVEEDVPRRGNATRTHNVETRLFTPVRASREAYRATNALLNHVGPGFDVETSDSDVNGEYDTMLDKFDCADE